MTIKFTHIDALGNKKREIQNSNKVTKIAVRYSRKRTSSVVIWLGIDPVLLQVILTRKIRVLDSAHIYTAKMAMIYKSKSIIVNAFDKDNQDSIEELIVASKQNSKKQQNYYYSWRNYYKIINLPIWTIYEIVRVYILLPFPLMTVINL